MSWTVIKDLKEKRATKFAAASAIRELANKESRDLSPDEQKQHDGFLSDVESFNTRLAREERAGSLGEAIDQNTNVKFADTSSTNELGMPEKDFQRFSLMKAVRSVLAGKQLSGIEAEVNKEMEKRMGRKAQGSFFMPTSLKMKRTLNLTSGAGSVMTTTEDTFIDVLRAKTLTNSIGATFLTGLHGKIAIPQKTSAASYYWVGEGGSPTASNLTLAQVLFTPHTIGAFSDITRQFAEQTSLDVEEMVTDDLMRDLALGVDIAAFQGTGTANQPTGILNTSGLPLVSNGTNGGSPDYAVITELETVVANNNADFGRLAYVTTPNARGYMKVTPRSTAAVAAGFIWGDDNTVNGYDAFASNVLPNGGTKGSGTGLSSMIFGNFNDLVIGMWGALDILVDPYTGSSSGTVRIVALQDLDIELRHVQSFAAMTDINTNVS
jgi:HK97 family phage major capsid protein